MSLSLYLKYNYGCVFKIILQDTKCLQRELLHKIECSNGSYK